MAEQIINGSGTQYPWVIESGLGLVKGVGSISVYTTSSSSSIIASGIGSVIIGSVSTEILSNNISRKAAIIANDSNQDIYLRLGSPAILNQYMRLNAYTGVFEITPDLFYSGTIHAICASGGKNITITELI